MRSMTLPNEHCSHILLCSAHNMRYFAKYTGEGFLLLDGGNGVLYTDSRYIEQASQQTNCEIVCYDRANMAAVIGGDIKGRKVRALGIEENVVTVSAYKMLSAWGIPLVGADALTDGARMIKTPEEIACIRQAAHLQDRAFSHMLEFLKVGQSEEEIAFELELFLRKNGAQALAFSTICASGENGALPHAGVSPRKIQPGDLLTMDYGAKIDGYCADITRTVRIEHIAKTLKDVYTICLEAQISALAALCEGAIASDVDAVARSIIKKAGYGDCFGHGLGHSLGLLIHESPALSPHDHTVLKAGMVVTVEPGIYLPKVGGVRIEDTVLITKTGHERLTTSEKQLQTVMN